MRTIVIALIFFIAGFVVGGWLWFKVSMDLSYDQMVNSLNTNFKDQLNTWSAKVNAILEQKKQEAIKQLEVQKEKILTDIKNKLKQAITEKIDNMFK